MRLIFLSFTVLFNIYVICGAYQYKRLLSESTEVVKEDIARDLSTSQILSAQRTVETLKKFGFSKLKLVVENTEFEENILSTKIPLIVDGLCVGYLLDLPSIKTILIFILGNTYLGAIFSIMSLLMLIFIILPLERYKKKVQLFIKNSKGNISWTAAPAQDDVIKEIHSILQSNILYLDEINKLDYLVREKDNMANMAKQVAHDIRSPLSVLNLLIPSFSKNPNIEKAELITHATKRIEEISESLLKNGYQSTDSEISFLEIKKMIAEKQFEISDRNIEIKLGIIDFDKVEKLKICIPRVDFHRILSNLLNNAIEAIHKDNRGIIEVTFFKTSAQTILAIRDNGAGIDPNIIHKIGFKGFSSGKESGNGLGIYHAKSILENSGGSLKIESSLKIGTTITIAL